MSNGEKDKFNREREKDEKEEKVIVDIEVGADEVKEVVEEVKDKTKSFVQEHRVGIALLTTGFIAGALVATAVANHKIDALEIVSAESWGKNEEFLNLLRRNGDVKTLSNKAKIVQTAVEVAKEHAEEKLGITSPT